MGESARKHRKNCRVLQLSMDYVDLAFFNHLNEALNSGGVNKAFGGEINVLDITNLFDEITFAAAMQGAENRDDSLTIQVGEQRGGNTFCASHTHRID